MPKVEIIRNGAKRSVMVDQRVAHALVRQGSFSYASEVSKPKRKAQVKDAPSSNEANKITSKQVKEKENPQTEPQRTLTLEPWPDDELENLPKGLTMSAGKPMTSARFSVKQNRSREELEAMTKADLKVLGQKIGLDLKPSEPKDVWVKKINRYMRRDMRAAR